MSSKKKYEYSEKKNYNRESDGLRQRRLKEESRWKYNPNQKFDSDVMDEEDLYIDPDFEDDRR